MQFEGWHYVRSINLDAVFNGGICSDWNPKAALSAYPLIASLI